MTAEDSDLAFTNMDYTTAFWFGAKVGKSGSEETHFPLLVFVWN